ncbi:MAG: hypothetical protein Q4E55_09785, partial [Bacteroidales bacterium]|nr:hypothetical protein [Bacteroidales bacterium]
MSPAPTSTLDVVWTCEGKERMKSGTNSNGACWRHETNINEMSRHVIAIGCGRLSFHGLKRWFHGL